MADRSNENMTLFADTSVRFEGLNYRQSPDGNKIEICDWVGAKSPALWTHMHDEHQLSIVHFGLRRFIIANRSFDVASGEMVFIPANTPHASVGLSDNATVSQEMFFAPGDVQLAECADVTISCMPSFVKKTDLTPECLLEAAVQNWSRRIASLQAINFPAELLDAVKSTPMLISEIADGASMSCEGFIRKFSRLVGMTPLEFRLAHKAKAARALLRLNIPPASVASDVGFSDQSHLGRIFKRSFGTSPARYRSIWSD